MLAIAAAIAIWILASSFLSANAEGAITNKTVGGHLQDTLGNSIGGASVVVEIWGGYWPDQDFFRTSQSTVTDSSGNYAVTINSNYWDPHNTIKVIASFGTAEATRMVEANDQEYQTVDITINLAIPEFSNLLGLVAMLAGVAVPVVVSAARRRAFATGRRDN